MLKRKSFMIMAVITVITIAIITVLILSILLLKKQESKLTTTPPSTVTGNMNLTTTFAVTQHEFDNQTNGETIRITTDFPATSSQKPICNNITLSDGIQLPLGRDSIFSAIRDFNNDNDVDILTVSAVNRSIRVYFGNDNASFIHSTITNISLTPSTINVVDLNHDNKLDLVMVDVINKILQVLLGVGDGTFLASARFNLPNNFVALNIADINSDGNLDFMIIKFDAVAVNIFLGLGNGTFMNHLSVDVGSSVIAVRTAHLNNDTMIDLIVATDFGFTLKIFLARDNGTYQQQISYSTGLYITDLQLVDLNYDNQLDIIISSCLNSSVSTIMRFINGSIRPRELIRFPGFGCSSNPIVQDIDGDHYKDFVFLEFGTNALFVLRADSTNGVRQQIMKIVPSFVTSVNLHDFNHDGILDIAVFNTGTGFQTFITTCA